MKKLKLGTPDATRMFTRASVRNSAAIPTTVGPGNVGGNSTQPNATPALVKTPAASGDLIVIFLLVVLFVIVERKEAIL
jgi:hypothetical protein